MPRLLPALLLIPALLSGCGSGGGAESQSSSPQSPAQEAPEAVTGHFFSYVSDGSHIHAVDMSSAEVTEVATLATPSEDLSYLRLAFRQGLLDGRTIEWSDLLYVDDGKLYLLPARSETTTPPVPRQLSSMSTIDTSCGKHASVSADGKHEGLLFFRPDAGEGCYGGTGTSYLITTDMGPEDAPIAGPTSWKDDIAISRTQKGAHSITGFIGLRSNKLVMLNTAHQTTAVLKEGVANINRAIIFGDSGKIFVGLTSSSNQDSQHLINLNSNTVISNFGPEFGFPSFDENQIYSLYTPLIPNASTSKVYVAGLDGSPAQEIPCTYNSASSIGVVIGDLMLAYTSTAFKTLNLKTCEEKTLINRTTESMYRLFIEDNVMYFSDPNLPLVHRLNIASLDDSTVAQAQLSGVTYAWEGSAIRKMSGLILLSNLDKSDGDSLRLENYSLRDEHLVLGALDSSITEAEASFWNSDGQAIGLGTVSFNDAEEQPHARLYSFKPEQAGSLTLLLEKDFLQKL